MAILLALVLAAAPCPGLADTAPPADRLDLAERFAATLPAADRARLDRLLPRDADGRIARCDQRDGTACDARAMADAIRAAGLSARFRAFACRPPQPRM